MNEDRLAVLVVCHANLCRSPMAERLLRQAFRERLGDGARQIDVFSAGTHAWPDRAMHPLASDVLDELGADNRDFRTQRLTPALIGRADLVLTATREQRSTCAEMEPAAVKRTFTLPQFGRLAEEVAAVGELAPGSAADRVRELVERIPMVRGQIPVPPAAQDEIADPVRFPIEVFRRCAGEIGQVVDVMTRLIAPSR